MILTRYFCVRACVSASDARRQLGDLALKELAVVANVDALRRRQRAEENVLHVQVAVHKLVLGLRDDERKEQLKGDAAHVVARQPLFGLVERGVDVLEHVVHVLAPLSS